MPFVDSKTFKIDNIGNAKILSVVPSLTELLFYFGLKNNLVGRTKFCIHPKEKLKNIEIVGGTKNLRLDVISNINPDIIIANKEENQKEDIESLAENHNVLLSDINNIQDFCNFNTEIGEIFMLQQKSRELNASIQQIVEQSCLFNGKSILYLIWKNPYMAVGKNTYINSIIEAIGAKNALNSLRYPEIKEQDIINSNADYIFLSSEPYPFKEKHISALEKLSDAKIILVDGEIFSWYSQRLLHLQAHINAIMAH